jgi:hypothetical protein
MTVFMLWKKECKDFAEWKDPSVWERSSTRVGCKIVLGQGAIELRRPISSPACGVCSVIAGKAWEALWIDWRCLNHVEMRLD